MSARPRAVDLARSGHIATVTVVILAYAVSIIVYLMARASPQGASLSLTALITSIALGAVYLWLSLQGYPLLAPRFGRHARAAYFIIQIALVFIIQLLLEGSGAIWLISMPLIATATTDLPPLPRWLVYVTVLASLLIPVYLDTGESGSVLFLGLTFSPAAVFVIVFVRLTQAAETAQTEAETLAAQLAEANERLSAYAVQAEELATTQERNRLAREIHDSLGHYLTVANVQIKAARAIMDRDPDRARLALDRAAELTQEGLAAVRKSVSALRESPLGNRSLPEAIAALVAETQAAGIVAGLSVEGAPRPLDPRAELTLYRAAQEGLTNVRKHARASRVDLRLDYGDPAAVSLAVTDNGLGGDPTAAEGFGLLGLEERARQLGGRLTTETAPASGFSLVLTLPSRMAPLPVEAESGVRPPMPQEAGL